jgi:hypothetical protein
LIGQYHPAMPWRGRPLINSIDPYDIALLGENVDHMIMDTVPAESLLMVPVQRMHTRQAASIC